MSAANSASAVRAAGRRPATRSGANRGGEQRQALRMRGCRERVDARVADTSLRGSDRAPERLIVVRVRDQLEIRHEVADLTPVVEANRADEPIGEPLAPQRLFQRATLRVRAIEDREVAKRQPRTERLTGRSTTRRSTAERDLLDDVVRLVAIIVRADDGRALARRPRRAQRLSATLGVRTDRDVREVEDLRRRPVVLFEPNDRGLREVALEVENVPNVRAAPAVDRLIVVTDDHDVRVLATDQLHEPVLRAVRVLILVHEDEAEAILILRAHVHVLLEDAHRQDQEVVERDGVRLPQRALELLVHRRHGARMRVLRHRFVLADGHERVLRVGDRVEDGARRVVLRRDAQALHDPLDDADGVILIVDREARRAPDEVRGAAKHPRADGVERAAPHANRLGAEEASDALAHLARRLVGERDREDVLRVDAVMLDEVRDARRQHARLAGSGAGEHQHWSFEMEYRVALRGIETGEPVSGHRRGHQCKITSNVAPRGDGTSSKLPAVILLDDAPREREADAPSASPSSRSPARRRARESRAECRDRRPPRECERPQARGADVM